MKTAYCPKSHAELAKASAGTEYGHVPGHQYHDVDIVVSHRPRLETFRVHVVENWGSAQGCDEEHGRREVVGRGLTIDDACSDAARVGKVAGIREDYLVQAISMARDKAHDNAEATTPGAARAGR